MINGENKEINRYQKGRWKEPVKSYQQELDMSSTLEKLRTIRGSERRPFFSHLTLEREIRIIYRFLIDDDYRLTQVIRDIKTRAANVRKMFTEYQIDIRNKKFIEETCQE